MKPLPKKIIIAAALVGGITIMAVGGYFLGQYWRQRQSSPAEQTETLSPCGDGVCQKLEKTKNLCPKDCQSTTPVSNNSTVVDSEAAETKLGFVAIHMEPGSGPEEQKNLTNPKTYWPNLISLIETADEFDVKLTLLFNPQWAEYILQDPEKLPLLRQWETHGHEIGYHQHGPQARGMNYWNGYTNQESYKSNFRFIGTIDDAMDLLIQLPADGKIYTVGMAAEKDRPYDWPSGMPYRVDGTNSGAVGPIQQETINGTTTTFLQHQLFVPGEKNSPSIDDLEKEIADMKDGEYLGVVFHAHNFTDETEIDYKELFKLLSGNLEILTVKDILGK